MASTTSSETYKFQAEINQLMSLIINTFYSNKDIFLRELISNASDAIEKARHGLLVDKKELRDFHIKVSADKENKTLTIEDNGIGMTKDELISNLGSIANSGTRQFMEARKQMEDEKDGNTSGSLIGQFGVGFYSAYLVANDVKVYSGKHCWESNAGGTFVIQDLEEPVCENGCRIVMTVKDDCMEYLEEHKLTEIVQKHSQFIDYPIKLFTTRVETKEVEDEETEVEDEKKEGDIEEVDGEDDKPKKKTKTVEETIEEWKTLNSQKPLWLRKPEDVTQEEYNALYKTITGNWDEPMKLKHFSAEGQIEYKALLYVPKQAPFDMFDSKSKKNNIKLYVKRVMIMDKCEDMLPDWLKFVSGVVDSEDLPLNVSREMLQQNSVIKLIKKTLVKKCIEMFTSMAEDEEEYKKFYDQYSTSLKIGVYEDQSNKDKLSKLLRYKTAKSGDNMKSLTEYVSEMKEGQEHIYFITGESHAVVKDSPFVKGLVEDKGFDVIFMTDPIDEYMCQSFQEFDGKKLVNITKNNKLFRESDEEYEKHLCKRMKEVLDISEVVVSSRLHNDPCCIVTPEYGWSSNMRRIMKAQAMQNKNNFQGFMDNNKQNILEINKNHKMIKKLQEGITKNTMKDHTINDIIKLVYETALISCGFSHENPSGFAKRVYRIIGMGIDVEDDEEEANDGLPPLPEKNDETDNTTSEEVSNMEEVD